MNKVTKKTFNNLCYAVANYIKESGGTAVVIGGISISVDANLKKRYKFIIDVVGNPPINKID